MIKSAREAAKKAYCPYSKFRVGAIVSCQDEKGNIQEFSGSNIENASYGLTICAERVALFNAVSAGYPQLLEMAVSCRDAKTEDPIQFKMPCGACRQAIQEFAVHDDIPIWVDGAGCFSLKELLPHGFKL